MKSMKAKRVSGSKDTNKGVNKELLNHRRYLKDKRLTFINAEAKTIGGRINNDEVNQR